MLCAAIARASMRIRAQDLAFVTAFEGYWNLAQKVGVFDYLLKPVTRQRFRSTLARARELRSEARSRAAN
jgi:response regulator of citrate/malate metabolism